jgi:hypothetical protein
MLVAIELLIGCWCLTISLDAITRHLLFFDSILELCEGISNDLLNKFFSDFLKQHLGKLADNHRE